MKKGRLLINGEWVKGEGSSFESINPSTEISFWEGREPSSNQLNDVFNAARQSLLLWKQTSLDHRLSIILKFKERLETEKEALATLISIETGKPRWESLQEVSAMCSKIPISIDAFTKRACDTSFKDGAKLITTRYKPHGVLLVFGPFNFPGHLPNGHIVPALIAGNVVVFKPSELTPAVGEFIVTLWAEAGLPAGVLQLVQGGGDIGKQLSEDERHDGLLFTGSSRVGVMLSRLFSSTPHRMLALEMGGNNPLFIHDADVSMVPVIVQSAFMSSGQRCTCARRLILLNTDENKELLKRVIDMTSTLQIRSWDDDLDSFYGPLISKVAMESVYSAYKKRVDCGGTVLLEMKKLNSKGYFLSPGIVDVTGLAIDDDECFGPLLSVYWVNSLDEGIEISNQTRYGLSASIFTKTKRNYDHFYNSVEAGVINWNAPTNGASSKVPFGGIKGSGNHRPSAFFAADYCSYPVASVISSQSETPPYLPGMTYVS